MPENHRELCSEDIVIMIDMLIAFRSQCQGKNTLSSSSPSISSWEMMQNFVSHICQKQCGRALRADRSVEINDCIQQVMYQIIHTDWLETTRAKLTTDPNETVHHFIGLLSFFVHDTVRKIYRQAEHLPVVPYPTYSSDGAESQSMPIADPLASEPVTNMIQREFVDTVIADIHALPDSRRFYMEDILDELEPEEIAAKWNIPLSKVQNKISLIRNAIQIFLVRNRAKEKRQRNHQQYTIIKKNSCCLTHSIHQRMKTRANKQL
jgi:DNA-directed RNA polymerase specialized sigma24 family protein